MSIVNSIKQLFTAAECVVYRCDECGATFRVDPDVESPTCSNCDSPSVRQINRV